MGMKHSGKSSLGSICARDCRLPFYDLDDLIAELARKNGFSTVRDLYRSAGREKFQACEEKAAKLLAEATERRILLAALGGGTVENSAAMHLLNPKGRLIYLRVEEEELYRRIAASGIPPFLEGERDPRELFRELYAKRSRLCEQWADEIVTLPLQSMEANAELLHSRICTIIDGREETNGG